MENNYQFLATSHRVFPRVQSWGPLLFVVFINDLPHAVKICSVLMYADDTVLYYSARNVTDTTNN